MIKKNQAEARSTTECCWLRDCPKKMEFVHQSQSNWAERNSYIVEIPSKLKPRKLMTVAPDNDRKGNNFSFQSSKAPSRGLFLATNEIPSVVTAPLLS